MANRWGNNGNSGRPKWLQNHCSHEIKTLALWKKSYDQPRQHIKKQKKSALLTKVHLVKAMVFPVVMSGCESWTIKKAEYLRINAFEFGAGEDSEESLGQQGDQTSQSKGNQP